MPQTVRFTEARTRDVIFLTREILRELPPICSDYIRAIEITTQPLTRYAYAIDLKLFFHYLINELPEFADVKLISMDSGYMRKITARHLEMYMEYLSYYIDPDDNTTVITNAELGKQRKLSSLRSFYKYLFKI